jgi:hypothetical protein
VERVRSISAEIAAEVTLAFIGPLRLFVL